MQFKKLTDHQNFLYHIGKYFVELVLKFLLLNMKTTFFIK